MSHVVKTALEQAFRELEAHYATKETNAAGWAATQPQGENAGYSFSGPNPTRPGSADATNAMTRYLNDDTSVPFKDEAAAILERILAPHKSGPEFAATAEKFVADLQQGKLPAAGIAPAGV